MLHAVILEESMNYGYPDYDGLWKNLISEMFEEFILFFAPNLYDEIDFSKSPDFLQQELFQEVITDKQSRRMADQIVKAPLINGKEKWILVHIEVQDKANDEFRKHMFHYFYRIYDRYDHEIYAIALLTNSKSHSRQDYFDYHYYGTSLIYKYNVFNFKEQNIEKLSQSSNPFAAAVLAGIYSDQAKNDNIKKFSFKRSLMIQVLKRFSSEGKNTRRYISALFYFIDYLLQTPETLQQKLREGITKYLDEEAKKMNGENTRLTPTWEGVLEDLEKIWSERAERRANYKIAKKLLLDHFPEQKVAELTELPIEEIQKIKEEI